MTRWFIGLLISFIVMFSPFSNVVFASQAETIMTNMISLSTYDEEIDSVKTPPFPKQYTSSILQNYGLSFIASKAISLQADQSKALSNDLCFLEMKCAIPIKYQSNYLD
ncbi:potassium:proton antiporter [Bacillus sp. NPDC077027]|uniref:potassium:proton antiporter n=1 Tax=Bacillus sp. NPDC077027 TaxID=3390548 RepID=UPI003D044143